MPPVEYHLLSPSLPIPLPLVFFTRLLFSFSPFFIPPLLLPHSEVFIVGICLRVRETLITTIRPWQGLYEELIGLIDRTEPLLGLVLLMCCHLRVPS